MEKTFTFRFFEVSRSSRKIPAMVDVFRSIHKEGDLTKRERQLATSYVVRLEALEDDGANAIVGELTRCQNTNLPSDVSAKRKALDVERLGHSIVFRLNHKTGVLGIQTDNRIISPGKVLEYLAAFDPSAIYSIAPVIDKNAWKKFNSGPTRKLTMKIANPGDLSDLSGGGKAAGEGIRDMADAYDAPMITVEISMGHRKGYLSSAINGLAKSLANMGMSGARLDALSAKTEVNGELEEIDLLEDRIVARDVLEIHNKDPDINWRVKRDYLCQEMKKLLG